MSLPGFEYHVVNTTEGYTNNWYLKNDYMCESPTKVNSIVSFYFLGYVLGAFLFFLPNQIGRKPTMTVSLISYVIGSSLVSYGSFIELKMLGLFI